MGAGQVGRLGGKVLLAVAVAALLAGTATAGAEVANGAGAAQPAVTTHHVLADNGVIDSRN